MSRYLFITPILRWLSEPANFNRIMAITFRAVAVLMIPLGLITFFKAGKTVFDLPASEILGGILFEMLYVVAIYGMVHVLYLRASDIDRLPAGKYNMFPLSALVIRAIGESYAAYLIGVSAGGAMYIWFTAKSIRSILDPLPTLVPMFGGPNFIGGIQFLAGGVLTAIAVLGLCYLLAEGLQAVHGLSQRTPVPESNPEENEAVVESEMMAERRMRAG